MWLVFQNAARPNLSPPLVISHLGDLNQMNSGVYCVPMWLVADEAILGGRTVTPNLSSQARTYLERLGLSVEDLFHHVVATLHSARYNTLNADALRLEGPRIPLPGWCHDSVDSVSPALKQSIAVGRRLACLLNPNTPAPGADPSAQDLDFRAIATPRATKHRNLTKDDLALTAGWGHRGQGNAVMPGKGHVLQRPFTQEERAALGEAQSLVGESTFDIYLNDDAFWCNVPAGVWTYKLGGYQVLKKWLSYREHKILGRVLKEEEVRHFSDTARRIAAILLLTNPGIGGP